MDWLSSQYDSMLGMFSQFDSMLEMQIICCLFLVCLKIICYMHAICVTMTGLYYKCNLWLSYISQTTTNLF